MNIFEAVDPKFDRMMEVFQKVDINTLTPVEALLKLNELKNVLGEWETVDDRRLTVDGEFV